MMSTWEYSKLIHSLNVKELGHMPQVDTIVNKYDPQSKKIIESLNRNTILPNELKFPDLSLYSNTKFTDIIYPGIYSNKFLLLSKQAANLLINLKLDSYQLYKCWIYNKNESREYVVIHLINDRADDMIDWDHSVFVYFKPFGHIEVGQVHIVSQNDYIDKIKKLDNLGLSGREIVQIKIKTLKLKDGTDSSFDLIKFSFPRGFYVSPTFKELIYVNKLTGFAFEEIEFRNKQNENIKPY